MGGIATSQSAVSKMIGSKRMKILWHETRNRLLDKGLLGDGRASLSVRCPEDTTLWLGEVANAQPILMDWREFAVDEIAGVHAAVYTARPDVGAVAWGGGPFGACLAEFGGVLPQIFDEQARHIGPMAAALEGITELESALSGGGNALLVKGIPLCLGTTRTRLALNLELFEKCAKAYILAMAAGGHTKSLPWWVRRIANSRLSKDQRRAATAFARGELPVESHAY